MSEVKHPKDQNGPTDVWVHKDTARIDLWYPRNNPVKYIHVGLMDVRAADGVRISYDFERDGWVIEQAQVFSWDGGDPECDPKWKEVAFIQAWASEVLQPWDDDYVGQDRIVADERPQLSREQIDDMNSGD